MLSVSISWMSCSMFLFSVFSLDVNLFMELTLEIFVERMSSMVA